MSQADGDPTEWPAQSAASLRELDTALRCSICSEFFNAPKLLPCGHTFCSQCIRRHGDAQQRSKGSRQCPQCRCAWDSAHLDQSRPVHALNLACRAFQSARPKLLIDAQSAASPAPSAAPQPRKRRRRTPAQPASTEPPARTPQPKDQHAGSDAEMGNAQGSDGSGSWAPSRDDHEATAKAAADSKHRAPVSAEQAAASAAPRSSTGSRAGGARASAQKAPAKAPAQPPAGCGICPICSRVFSVSMLERHVQSCLISAEAGPSDSKAASGGTAGVSAEDAGAAKAVDLTGSPARGNSPAIANLPPKLCFAIMKEKDIRTKLREAHLSDAGTKAELQRRYQDFRQYAATAHDRGDTASLKRLARRFSKDSKRTLERQGAAEAAAEAVPGADHEFAHLIESCRRMAHEARRQRGEPVERSQRAHLRAAALQAALAQTSAAPVASAPHTDGASNPADDPGVLAWPSASTGGRSNTVARDDGAPRAAVPPHRLIGAAAEDTDTADAAPADTEVVETDVDDDMDTEPPLATGPREPATPGARQQPAAAAPEHVGSGHTELAGGAMAQSPHAMPGTQPDAPRTAEAGNQEGAVGTDTRNGVAGACEPVRDDAAVADGDAGFWHDVGEAADSHAYETMPRWSPGAENASPQAAVGARMTSQSTREHALGRDSSRALAQLPQSLEGATHAVPGSVRP